MIHHETVLQPHLTADMPCSSSTRTLAIHFVLARMHIYSIHDSEEYDRLTQEIGDSNHPSTCEICRKHKISSKTQMIECDYCVRNFHKHCLAECPKDLSCWECPVCTGDVAATQGMTTLSEIFCRTEDVIKIGCIQRLWKQGGQTRVDLQEYERTQVLCKMNAGATHVPP